MSELEQRLRAYIEQLENRTSSPIVQSGPVAADDRARNHWFACGEDDAIDSVITGLYDVLQEER